MTIVMNNIVQSSRMKTVWVVLSSILLNNDNNERFGNTTVKLAIKMSSTVAFPD